MRKARYANKRERYSRARNEFIVTIPVEEYREWLKKKGEEEGEEE